jgi:hypothetical protein
VVVSCAAIHPAEPEKIPDAPKIPSAITIKVVLEVIFIAAS